MVMSTERDCWSELTMAWKCPWVARTHFSAPLHLRVEAAPNRWKGYGENFFSGGGRGRLEGRRSDASQPYRFVSRSVPRHPFSSNFAELGSPRDDICKAHILYPYRKYRKLRAVLM